MENLLQQCVSVKKPGKSKLGKGDLLIKTMKRSKEFPMEFPIDTIRCQTLIANNSKTILEENIESTYPIIHERVLKLFCEFLLHKRNYGTLKEKALYKDMTVTELVDRLLTKRAVMFVGPNDKNMLIDGILRMAGWEKIGSDDERPPLVLKDCLSYDELKLSAMLYVSGFTIFINDGSRFNKGVEEKNKENIETRGIIMGLIGTRLNKLHVMEGQELIITDKQNVNTNGYGEKLLLKLDSIKNAAEKERTLWRNIWSRFYNESMLTFDEAKKQERNQEKNSQNYTKKLIFDSGKLFNNYIYRKHLSIPFDCALLEAHDRAMQSGKFGYLHVVGIGLGVWRAFMTQDAVFVVTILERIKELIPVLHGLSDVHLSYMRNIPEEILTSNGTFIKCDSHPKGGITVHMSNREPSSRLSGPHEGKLLVETYAWDGNAQPGNEFWAGSLYTSGDPAAACSSQVAELHNSLINTKYVSGNNLHVASSNGIHHISEYVQKYSAHLKELF